MKILRFFEKLARLFYFTIMAAFAGGQVKNNKVLVIIEGNLGDGLVNSSAVIAIKNKYAQEGKEVYMLCQPGMWKLLKLIPEMNGVRHLPFQVYKLPFPIMSVLNMRKELDSEGYERIIGLSVSYTTYMFCAGIKGKRYMFMMPELKKTTKLVDKVFSRRVDVVDYYRENENMFSAYERFMREIGFQDFNASVTKIPSVGKFNREFDKEYASIIVDSSNPVRRWPIEYFSELIHGLLDEHEFDLCFLGMDSDDGMEELIANVTIQYPGRTRNLIGKTKIREWIELIRGSIFIVGVDSGAIHVASSVGTQAFCLAGLWRAASKIVPYPESVVGDGTPSPICIFREDADQVQCANCIGRTGKYGKTNPECYELCENKKPCICLTKIKPSQVLVAINGFLN